jgi:hypothetical protein
LYQWGDVIDVKGDGRAKRLGTPEFYIKLIKTFVYL